MFTESHRDQPWTHGRIMKRADYARCGAELGIATAGRCLSVSDKRAQCVHLFRARTATQAAAADLVKNGASVDAVELYLKAFEDGYAAQMANPDGFVDIEVIT